MISRKKVNFGLVASGILITSSIYIKSYDEPFNKNLKEILTYRNINYIIPDYAENTDKDLMDLLVEDVNILQVEDNKAIEEESVGELKERDIINEITVAENIPENKIIIESPYNSSTSNITTNNSSSERKEIQSTPNRGATEASKRENNEVPKGYLNEYVLKVINTYPRNSSKYPYLLNEDYENYNGVTENIYYKGQLLLKAHPSGIKYSHCSGITFEVFFKAIKMRNEELGKNSDDINGMTSEELFDFIMDWYVANGTKAESNLAVALEKYGLGIRINNMEDLRQGDFIDFSRENNTGHSAVFINWIRDGDKIIGLKYWSSQESTNGIAYKEEYFNIKDKNGKKYRNVMIDNLHMTRVK